MKNIDIQQLSSLLVTKIIENVDLTDIDLNDIDFSFCVLKNVCFSTKGNKIKLISGVNFYKARLTDVKFDNSVLLNIDFSNSFLENCSFQVYCKILEPTITKVTFEQALMNKCRFRDSIIKWSDFRYAEITNTTFENSTIDFCDFYRTYFHGINIFKKAKISNSSLNYTLFEGTIIRKDNLVSGAILQEDKDKYREFLVEWKNNGPGIRKTDSKVLWEPKDLEKELDEMHEHAENIYKNLNGNWVSNGFLSDANWAYVKGRKEERKRLKIDLGNAVSIKMKMKGCLKILGNYFCDFIFGYGESIFRVVSTYVVLIIIFGIIIYFLESDNSIMDSFIKSLLNMLVQTDEGVHEISWGMGIINTIQSSIGILLTGVFGFIIANRIRHQ